MQIYLLFGKFSILSYICAPEGEIGLWCKGSTADFDSACLGSNPSNPTENASNQKPFRTFIKRGFKRFLIYRILFIPQLAILLPAYFYQI